MIRHLLVGVSGFSGSGKDTITNRLKSQHGAIQIGMTDPAKRHMAEVYGFTEEQLFGPSEKRNAGDLRYPKNVFHELKLRPATESELARDVITYCDDLTPMKLDENKTYFIYESSGQIPSIMENLPCAPTGAFSGIFFIEAGDSKFWLSPRETLQRYCELMNTMYEDTWIRKSIETHKMLPIVQHEDGDDIALKYSYDRMVGLTLNDPERNPDVWRSKDSLLITCSADYRHWHEIRLTRKLADTYTPVLVRIKRPGIESPPYPHRSETEQATIPDSEFDFVLNNDGSIDDLNVKVDEIVGIVREPRWAEAMREIRWAKIMAERENGCSVTAGLSPRRVES